ncbi:MAG: hypothetical protein ABSB71_07955 [Candidatus Bathyarchaeia archaeon]
MALEELNTFLGLPAFMWFFIAIAVGIAFVIVITVHEFFIMTSFAKHARAMKWSKGLAALIQDNNVVRLLFSNGELPEGLFLIRGKWFLRPQTPYLGNTTSQRGPGRPSNEEKAQTQDGKAIDVLSKDSREALTEVLQCPILEGVGKPLFVGCVNQPMLTNISTVAHADLTRIREIIPETLTQTQLDALHTYSKIKGIKMAGKEQMKIIYLAIAAVMVIGSLGLIVYLLTQHSSFLLALI